MALPHAMTAVKLNPKTAPVGTSVTAYVFNDGSAKFLPLSEDGFDNITAISSVQ